jgi:Transcriptional regulators containing an AAA-type ATPase domain and a DNA-binding domain
LEDGLVVKIEGRPVLWDLTESKSNKEILPFNDFIGSNGSLKNVVSQCEAAVNYPPNGLSIIITGNSGVGKSFLAKQIYNYAVSSKSIASNAPFLTLNCADYANNPELLSSILFGYVRGAFTGANEDKSGLLEQADGGYLFLDEVHRLSSENQENYSVLSTVARSCAWVKINRRRLLEFVSYSPLRKKQTTFCWKLFVDEFQLRFTYRITIIDLEMNV